MTWRVSAGTYMGTAVYHLQGDFDSNAGHLRAALAGQPNRGSVLFDLTGVDSLEPSGLSELLRVIRSIQEEGGRVAVAGIRPSVVEVLRASGFDRQVHLADTPLEAIGWLSQAGEIPEAPVVIDLVPLRVAVTEG